MKYFFKKVHVIEGLFQSTASLLMIVYHHIKIFINVMFPFPPVIMTGPVKLKDKTIEDSKIWSDKSFWVFKHHRVATKWLSKHLNCNTEYKVWKSNACLAWPSCGQSVLTGNFCLFYPRLPSGPGPGLGLFPSVHLARSCKLIAIVLRYSVWRKLDLQHFKLSNVKFHNTY